MPKIFTSKKVKLLFLLICVLQFFYLLNFRSGFRYEILKNPFISDAGINFAVTKEVVESGKIIEKNKLNDFNLSPGLIENVYFYQRFIEFNYPIRIKEKSKNIIYLKDESAPSLCKIIEVNDYLKLIKC